MTMKIEGQQHPLDTADAARRSEAVRQSEAAAGAPSTGAGKPVDSVSLSDDARLLTDAMKAAGEAPDIRQDVVERMRKLLEAGEIGKDSTAMAERLIDHLLEK
jgi:flagellar biosynthesis anti-sigma factor FlgM